MYRTAIIVLLLLAGSATVTRGADWPTYLGNNARAGTTSQQLKLPLREQWVYSAPAAPRRAWSGPEGRTVEGKELRDRVKFDDALHVAVVGGRVYFGSSVDHQLHCLDAVSGQQYWSFYTGGPIRLAPTVADGRVYFGSDDGFAYCLDSQQGELQWKLRLGPADEWLIARGEMISRWPVRTGVLVDDGVAYFGAGIFPHDNVYMCAVNADRGEIIWKNDRISHQDAGRNDLSPQGYLLAAADRIYVPSGRTRPRAFNRTTGEMAGASATSLAFTQTVIAGTDALIAGGRLHTYSLGTRLAVDGESSYAATGREVIRMDRREYAVADSKRRQLVSERRTLERQLRSPNDKADEIKARIAEIATEIKNSQEDGVVWSTRCSAEGALVVAGDLVFAGDHEQVTAFSVDDGREVWQTSVDGHARGIAAADGEVFVSTTTGKIYCFADATSTGSPASTGTAALDESPYPADKWTAMYERAAERILKATQIRRGFCLVAGSEQGRLAYELAKRSELKIYAVEPDAQKVAESRRALSSAGLYGSRITVHQRELSAIPYSNYSSNLIVSDHLLLTGETPGPAHKLARHLKPAGGMVAMLPPPAATRNAAQRLNGWLESMQLVDSATINSDEDALILTRGTLPGAGNWSHQYGDAANTANSNDKLVKGGLGVLWYGDPGPGMMVNRHQGAVGPLVVNGRMFVQGEDSLMAYDAYNGLFLWKVENAKAIRTGVFQNRSPGNLAASEDRLFHMVRAQVFEHDAATGEVKATHRLPPSVDSETHEWGYLAFRDGLLFGTGTSRSNVAELNRRRRGNPGNAATDALFAIDTETGKHLWVHQGKSIDFQTIALGPDRVYFIDSTITSEQREAIVRQDKSELKKLSGAEAKRAEERMKKLDVRLAVALDSRRGDVIWSNPVDVTDCSDIGIGGGKLTMMFHDDVLILCGANANGHYWKQFVAGEFSRRRIVALYALRGDKLWAKDANYRHRPIILGDQVIAEPWMYDLKSGEQKMRKHPLTGAEVPWSMMRPGHHCGMLTASDNLLLFRSGYTGFYDLEADAGTRHFAGHRLGCWINAIPTNGLVVIPEASAGCVCMFSIASTIVMEPREPRRPWTLYSGVGATTPVKQMALNLGAPGDRRDQNGKLWLAYPRPTPNPRLETSLDLALKLDTVFLEQGKFFSRDGDESVQSGSPTAWLTASGARGLARISLPLLGKDDKPARYAVRLFVAGEQQDRPGDRVFDVLVQGEESQQNVDVARQAEPGQTSLVLETHDVLVSDKLVVDLRPKSSGSSAPIVTAIAVQRTD